MAGAISIATKRPVAVINRRREERFSAAGNATLSWSGYTGEYCATRGQITNASTRGLAVEMHEPVAVGQMVGVELAGAAFRARIRTCRSYRAGIRAGLEIVSDDLLKQWEAWYRRSRYA